MPLQKNLLNSIIDSLEGVKSGDGYLCFCPSHDDKSRSLSVTIGKNNKLIFYCHAGCDYERIKHSLIGRGLMQDARLKDVSAKIVAVYEYRSESGELIFQKIRRENKTFYLRKKTESGWSYKGVASQKNIPLYKLPELIEGVKNGKTIFICEGEKDTDRLRTLDLVATTNFDGAGKWRPHYGAWLKGAREIVILTDNDEPGQRHGIIVGSALSRMGCAVKTLLLPGLPEKGDISDWIEGGGTREDLLRIVAESPVFIPPPQTSVEEGKVQNEKSNWANYSDYQKLFETILNGPRRDIFSGELATFDKTLGLWCPARNRIELLRSEAAIIQETTGLKFKPQLVNDHLIRYEQQLTPELLVDLPEWDGQDRVKKLCESIILKERNGLAVGDFEYFVKDWLRKAWLKLEDPSVQNRIIVLKGDQGAGKDWWIETLCDGADQFAQWLNVVTGDKDTFLALSNGMFLKIDEFDKSAKAEVSLLKHILTASGTDMRAAYDRRAQRRFVRCSFISSCNVDDILRDHTGARRYLIFDIEKIIWDYPRGKETQKQILAQGRAMANGPWTVDHVAEKNMRTFLGTQTPDDPKEEAIAMFVVEAVRAVEALGPIEAAKIRAVGWVPNEFCVDVFEKVSRVVGFRVRTIRHWLKQENRGIRTKNQRGYVILPDEWSENGDGGDASMTLRNGEASPENFNLF